MDTIIVPMLTVSKVLLAAVIGGASSQYFTFPQYSQKGLSHLTVKVFLPALLCSRLALNLSWDLLLDSGFGWAIAFSCIPLAVGYILARFVFAPFIPNKEYIGLFVLASTFQNVVSFGLGVTQNIRGIEWLTPAALAECQTVVFLYNIVPSLLLWSLGTHIVRRGKEADDCRDSSTSSSSSPNDGGGGPPPAVPNGITTNTNTSSKFVGRSLVTSSADKHAAPVPIVTIRVDAPYSAKAPAGAALHPSVAALYESINTTTTAPSAGGVREAGSPRDPFSGFEDWSTAHNGVASQPGPSADRGNFIENNNTDLGYSGGDNTCLASLRKFGVETLSNITVLSSLVGIVLALVPPLTYLVKETPIGTIIFGAMSQMGAGTVPMTLLQLGTNLATSSTKKKGEEGAAAQNGNEAHNQNGDDASPPLPPLQHPQMVEMQQNSRHGENRNNEIVMIVQGENNADDNGKNHLKDDDQRNHSSTQPAVVVTAINGECEKDVAMVAPVTPPLFGRIVQFFQEMEVPGSFVVIIVLTRLVIIPAIFLGIFFLVRRLAPQPDEAPDVVSPITASVCSDHSNTTAMLNATLSQCLNSTTSGSTSGALSFLPPLPTSKAFQLTILVESCAPTAINSSVLCSLYSYRTGAYTQALLVMYVCSILSTTLWLSVYLHLLG